MTDDEAFIRTIVASPGDDSPRLVYADWLEEHGDERVAYLRLEAEWAKSRDTKLETRLRMTANGLDPVWVARVSRPPAGICCDHIRFQKRGPDITLADIDSLEHEFQISVSAEFRAFLFNYNGGIPQFVCRQRLSAERIDEKYLTVNVKRFFSLDLANRLKKWSLHHAIERYRNQVLPRFLEREPYQATPDEIRWYWDFLPIADMREDIFDVLIGARKNYIGNLRLIDWSIEPTTIANSQHMSLGRSFAEFIDRSFPFTAN